MPAPLVQDHHDLDALRAALRRNAHPEEGAILAALAAGAGLDDAARIRIAAAGAGLVRDIRGTAKPGMMEVFLAEYGLSTDEGVALMCLAEALLRVPDAETIDALIEDKIAPSDWGRHLGRSSSSLVNASTWALMLTGRVLEPEGPGLAGTLRGLVKRMGEPVIRTAVARAMREMGRQFVLGEDIDAAMTRARAREAKGFTYSYDMLGEAARTMADADRYHEAYAWAIERLAPACLSDDIRENPGISVKLSALHPRYEAPQRARMFDDLVARTRILARAAAAAGMGFNIDAEEADRLDLSLDVIAAVLDDPGLAGWGGFGVVVQAYGPRAGFVLDWLHALAEARDRRLMVRLVKGAYWDTEIKRAQVLGLERFPVFTRKISTDVSYIACARKLLAMTDRLYPQFATHNAHTVAAILDMAENRDQFEFQRLHGMGERLHDLVAEAWDTRHRIYAPVGAHRDLLAYLVRRLLENGANSSFVNQIVDEDVSPEEVASCPFEALEALGGAVASPAIRPGPDLFAPERPNARGWDWTDAEDLAALDSLRGPFRDAVFEAAPLLAATGDAGEDAAVTNPATGADVGRVRPASSSEVAAALAAARPWSAAPDVRARALRAAADHYEADAGALIALAQREAGKTLPDAIAELREAVDFLRYYAARAGEVSAPPHGVFAAISPWNFPLAIFTGQIAGALAAGNGVLAKPAEQTPLIAARAVGHLHAAGVPPEVLQFLPGDGATVGAALTSDPRICGVVFTGSTETARVIRAAMARHLKPGAPLIAETGGLNAMIVDSTALPEQAVRDILASAFQSAGQRCSAARMLYVQEDIAEGLVAMLTGAMDCLSLGDPWDIATDVGPVIDAEARARIDEHIAQARAEGRVIHALRAPREGIFCPPTLIRVGGIADLGEEVFGPVLHVATFRADELDAVVDAVNATGYGLTFGLHTRIDDRVEQVVSRLAAGNAYVNRNQIGAVVGSQPFGGEGLSGTGPKAGGAHYVARFAAPPAPVAGVDDGATTEPAALRGALARSRPATRPLAVQDLPGPTGESNRLSLWQRAPFLCLGPGKETAQAQVASLEALGGLGVAAPGLAPAVLEGIVGISGALWWGDAEDARPHALALARRPGPILPLVTGAPDHAHVLLERHLCIDTTAAGGNAALLADAGRA